MSKWTTRDGVTLRIVDMTNGHLLNAIGYFRRNGRVLQQTNLDLAWAAYVTLHGEMATYYAEQDLDRLERESVDDYIKRHIPIFCELLKEASKRGLINHVNME